MNARIVFDLDGTLIHSAPDIHLGVANMLAEQGLAQLDQATVVSFIGNGLPHLAGLVMAATGIPENRHEEITASLMRHYDAINGQLTRPFTGVPEALDALRGAGHRLAVCTNKPEAPARDILRMMALDCFDAVIGGNTLPQRKPDPAPLHAALAALGDGPALYVGDSEVDAETAERAGVPFLLFTEGYRKTPADSLPHLAVFSDFAALPGLIEARLAEI
ncbi:phosphoglycolate phosphatase [Tropicibacter sp. S64]|uniref:phosphoglycolate phosphatase n=1 Tax=Tropicibacter sp. S64 TaxID=3415122 RepID=UPI003C7C7CEC